MERAQSFIDKTINSERLLDSPSMSRTTYGWLRKLEACIDRVLNESTGSGDCRIQLLTESVLLSRCYMDRDRKNTMVLEAFRGLFALNLLSYTRMPETLQAAVLGYINIEDYRNACRWWSDLSPSELTVFVHGIGKELIPAARFSRLVAKINATNIPQPLLAEPLISGLANQKGSASQFPVSVAP